MRVRRRAGAVSAAARLTDAVRPDTVFMPFHWAGAGSANRLTNDATDPISGMPEFKVCAVDAWRPAAAPAPIDDREIGAWHETVVVVGNGMVGARFVEDLLPRTPPAGSGSPSSAPRSTSPTTGSC